LLADNTVGSDDKCQRQGLSKSGPVVKIETMPSSEEIMGHDAKPLTALDVADYFVALVDMDSGDNITNLKLQKLLYYAQGFHVAMHDREPLFSESVLAWPHGPVVRQVYSHYSSLKWHPIDQKSTFHFSGYAPEIREILEAVYTTYGQFSAKKLEDMTHEESPWLETQQRRVISLELLANYFTPMVQAGQKNRAVGGRPIWPTNSFRFQRRNEIARKMAVHYPRLRAMARSGPIDVD
jgi:uncharacterized phage-associated protein